MKATESALRHPPGNRTRTDAGAREVRRRHDPVPARRESENCPIAVHNSPRDAFRIGVW